MRFPDWQTRLTEYLALVSRRQFTEGEHDCARFAAGAVEAMTGDNHGKAYPHKTIKGALTALKEAGFDSHIDYAASLFRSVPVAMAQPGDLAVVVGDLGPALGVVQGSMIYVVTKSGLGLVPLTSAQRTFEVI